MTGWELTGWTAAIGQLGILAGLAVASARKAYRQRNGETLPVPAPVSPWPWLTNGTARNVQRAGAYWSPEPIRAYKWITADWIYVPGKSGGSVGTMPAICDAPYYRDGDDPCGDPPGLDCTCGWYAWKHHPHIGQWHRHYARLYLVELSGRVIEHERGYRAERLRIVRQITPLGTKGEIH